MSERKTATFACVAAFLAGILLHVDRLPLWCTGFALAAGCWRAAREVRPALRLPGRRVRLGLALLALTGVLLEFRTLNGLAAGTALLAVMGALKLFETRARRDQLIVIAVALVLLLAACLDRQGLARVPLYVAELYLCITALALAATPRAALDARRAAALAGRCLASAAPLAVLLFFLFPRIAGSFWALPSTGNARTGLGDEMSPGDIDSLTESDEPVFRVRFVGPSPPPPSRYWRGPVLHEFDGRTWMRDRRRVARPLPLDHRGTAYHYRITLEPEKRNWLFALEKPAAPVPPGVSTTFDDQLLTAQPLEQARSFELTSYPTTITLGELPPPLRRLDTRLDPTNRNPRSRALAQTLRARARSDADYVAAVLELFRHDFLYTLTPPRLDRNAVDEFLFSTKRGFCGHYASAFVVLMRAAGVPAHVVTGYLGGEWNPLGGYFIVRQSDAHAWAEVWLEGRGWTRVDPTAVVAPERLNRGLFELMPEAMSTRERLVRAGAWIGQVRLAWDAADSWWQDQMLHYDFRRQMALLQRLGVVAPNARTLAIGFGAALGVWLLWIGWQSRAGLGGRRLDPLAASYARLCARLARAGVPRTAAEGPLRYAQRIGGMRPDLAPTVRGLCARYAALRFGRPAALEAERRQIAEFRAAVRAFRPRPASRY